MADYRVTVTLGQDSAEQTFLESHAGALKECVLALPGGQDAAVVVDPVKAAVLVVVVVPAEDAVTAIARGLDLVAHGLRDADLDAPTSIVTAESESVPAPAHTQDVRPHPTVGVARPASS